MQTHESWPMAVTGLGAARPLWCPPIDTSVDPCELRYSVDIPIYGRAEVGVPINHIVYDAMASATSRLPDFLPGIYSQLMPYVNRMRDSLIADAESVLPDILDDLLERQVMPKANKLKDNIVAEAEQLRNEVLISLGAMTAAILVGLGVTAWWIKQR